jgi:hypothetical protein
VRWIKWGVRRAAIVAAVALLVPTIMVGTATAATTTRTAAAASMRPDVTGPPLGYYYTELRTCQKSRHLYYHDKAFYRACQAAREIVSNANNTCDLLADAGIVLSGITIINGWDAWATFAIISGVTVACQV